MRYCFIFYLTSVISFTPVTELGFVTKGRRNLKILNGATGKTKCILRTGQTKRIENIMVSNISKLFQTHILSFVCKDFGLNVGLHDDIVR